MQAAVVHGVKAEFLNQKHHFLFGCRIVAGHRQSNAARRVGRQALVLEMVGVDVVEHLHDGTAQVLLHPFAFREIAGFQLRHVAVTQQRVIVARVDDGYVGSNAREQIFGQVGNVLQRDGHHDDFAVQRRFPGGHRFGTGFLSDIFQRFGAA